MRENGRSMVEMLGVLAIIGVLSVGVISGYSKAMMKYKLNKQRTQISELLNNSIITAEKFSPPVSTNYAGKMLIPYYIKMKIIPDEMIHDGVTNYVYDIFGNEIEIAYYTEPTSRRVTYLRLLIKSIESDLFTDQCINIIQLFQLFQSYIYSITISKIGTEGDGSQGIKSNDTCTEYDRKYGHCLENLSLEYLANFCNTCNKEDLDYCLLAVAYYKKDL